MSDRGGVYQRLAVWAGDDLDVRGQCERLRHNLLAVPLWEAHDAGDFYRTIRALCRDLGRTVGEPDEDRPVGKCSRLSDDELCRGQLLRTADGKAVYCRRCGDKPELTEQQVWVTLKQAADITGKPLETIRTWYKRGQVGWSPPLVAGLCWLPIVVRRAAVATLQHSSDTVNHGSGAEPSPPAIVGLSSGPDADVLGRYGSRNPLGNVTPPVGASTGKPVAPDPSP